MPVALHKARKIKPDARAVQRQSGSIGWSGLAGWQEHGSISLQIKWLKP
ncbi:hypothetical protein [Thiohalophilus sp.]|nr:hypothetical protein [Thiohalophilus sp.]MDZ7802748.1 hypothetical protein [Thiohalophilus sp.]